MNCKCGLGRKLPSELAYRGEGVCVQRACVHVCVCVGAQAAFPSECSGSESAPHPRDLVTRGLGMLLF